MMIERLASDNHVSISELAHKVNFPNLKSCAKRKVVNLQNRVVQLSDDTRLWR